MVIIRLSPGLANAIMELCSGYAFAWDRNDKDIVLDVGECQNDNRGFLLDLLNIPNHTKVSYNITDINHYSHSDFESIPQSLRENVTILNKTEYKSLYQVGNYSDIPVVYLSDFFLSKECYYKKYWNQLRNMISWRGQNVDINEFINMISNKVSVAIHIRRGDMLFADFAIDILDDYYKAAIVYIRNKIDRNCLFCVFSDDIEYAKKLLGYDDNVHFIHFLGNEEVDLEEFLCMSLCDYRVISNNSTFSICADRLHEGEESITFYQGDMDVTFCDHFKSCASYYTKKMMNKLRKLLNIRQKPVKKFIDGYYVKKYAKAYKPVHSTISNSSTLIEEIEKCNKAEEVLRIINSIEVDAYRMPGDDISLRYAKYKALYNIGEYARALSHGDCLWGHLKEDRSFLDTYVFLLNAFSIHREAELLTYNPPYPVHYIIIPGFPTSYTKLLYGLGEVGVGLSKMGQRVSVISAPSDDTEAYFMSRSEKMTNRRGTYLGCSHYMISESAPDGVVNFIKQKQKNNRQNEIVVVISREKSVYEKKLDGVVYLYPDFSDDTDPEKEIRKKLTSKDLSLLENEADYILTSKEHQYPMNDRHKVIKYDNNTSQIPFWSVKDRWDLNYLNRLSERAINICTAIENSIQFFIQENYKH